MQSLAFFTPYCGAAVLLSVAAIWTWRIIDRNLLP